MNKTASILFPQARSLLVSRWDCWVAGRENISRKILAAELTACMMTVFMVCIVGLYVLFFVIEVYIAAFYQMLTDSKWGFQNDLYDVYIRWGLILYCMIVLGIFMYAGIMRLASMESNILIIAGVVFLIFTSFIIMVYASLAWESVVYYENLEYLSYEMFLFVYAVAQRYYIFTFFYRFIQGKDYSIPMVSGCSRSLELFGLLMLCLIVSWFIDFGP